MGLVSGRKPAQETFKPYSNEEKAALAEKYTPEQIRAIEAGEAAIDPNDLDTRGVIRTDLGALQYLEDFSQTRPVLDRAARYRGPIDPNTRLMTSHEMRENWINVEKEYKRSREELKAQAPPQELNSSLHGSQDPYLNDPNAMSRLDLMKVEDQVSTFIGTNGRPIPTSQTTSFLAPGLPKKFIEDDEGSKAKDEADPRDPDGLYNRLMKQTGLTLDEIFDYKIKVLVRHRVVNQTRLGKIASVYCLAIAGNGNGRLGIGEAKGQEAEETQSNARIAAIRNMEPIPRYEERTIFGEVEGKVSAVEVRLMTRPPGKTKTPNSICQKP